MYIEEIKNNWLSTLKPPPKLNLVEWAEKNRILSKEASSEPGLWRTSRVEVARGAMLAVTNPGVHTISIILKTYCNHQTKRNTNGLHPYFNTK